MTTIHASLSESTAAQARARGVITKIRRHRIAGLGSLRITCHTMKLIDEILRAGETANESVLSRSGLRILKTNDT